MRACVRNKTNWKLGQRLISGLHMCRYVHDHAPWWGGGRCLSAYDNIICVEGHKHENCCPNSGQRINVAREENEDRETRVVKPKTTPPHLPNPSYLPSLQEESAPWVKSQIPTLPHSMLCRCSEIHQLAFKCTGLGDSLGRVSMVLL